MTSQIECMGTVVAVQANFYQVRLDQPIGVQNLLCTRRTRLKKMGQRVMVGDRVKVTDPDYTEGRGSIMEVLPRLNELERPLIANVQQILLLFALTEPDLDKWQLSRFLVKAESSDLSIILCFNKIDLIVLSQQQEWQETLREWGYDPLFISVKNQQGLENLATLLKDKTTLLFGPSGMGKSSLINALIPNSHQRVNEVSGKLQKGRHTTRHVELFDLPFGGFLADSPGFNQPDVNFDPEELVTYFPEARKQFNQGTCQFNDCLHRNEPHCVIRGDWERYEHYLQFLEEAIARQQKLHHQPDPETSVKLKIKASGKHQYEPKLETKKYRRPSRRQRHQQLQELYDPQNEQ